MKKLIILLIASMVLFANLVHSQKTNPEIANTILQNKQANEELGIKNPDQIKPGETLIYTEGDGKNHFVKVKEGDSQWQIVKNLKEREFQPQEISLTSQQPPVATENSDPEDYLLWLAIIIAMALLILFLVFKLWNVTNKNEVEKVKVKEVNDSSLDPVNSGHPFKQGGINDEEAFSYATAVAARQYPNDIFTVKEVTKGKLSGENLEVYYQGEVTPKRRTFEDFPAYRGTIVINETEQYVYFLQGCGNDVKMGNFFHGQKIKFVPDVNIPVMTSVPEKKDTTSKINDFSFSSLADVAERSLVINGGKLTLEIATDGSKKFELEVFEPVKLLTSNKENSNHLAEAVNHN